jgi:photosystem II stability/assembly factor-like uncharacterized protein
MRQLTLLLLLALAVVNAEWVPVGPDGGNVLALAVDYSNPTTMYCVPYEYPANSRVFRTSDQGASWSPVGVLPTTAVAGLAVDRHDPLRLYALSGGNSVLVSSDGGANWRTVSLPGYGVDLKSDPGQPGRVMAAGYTISGQTFATVFVSTDFGSSWTTRTLGPDTNYAYCLDFDPVNPGVAYVGCYRGMVFRTTDGGSNWSLRNGGLPSDASLMGISVNSGDPCIICAAASDGLFRTTDAGANWSQVGTVARVYSIEFSPCVASIGYLIGYDSTARVFVSTDAGASWSVQPSSITLGKANSLIADPANGDGIFLPGGMGVSSSSDRGATWSLCNTGLRIAAISTISVSPWDRRRVYVEAAGNGVFSSLDCGANWVRCEDFLSCGSICGIGVAPGSGPDMLWALEGLG